MTDDFPTRGDNFVVVGPWNILEGAAWHDWQCEALRARICGAESRGEMLVVQKLRRELHSLTASGPAKVVLGPQARRY
jgi:hypothetical protein